MTLCIILISNVAYIKSMRENGLYLNAATALPFHALGIYFQLFAPLVTSHFVGLLAPMEHLGSGAQIPTPECTIAVTRLARCNAIMAVPFFFEVCPHPLGSPLILNRTGMVKIGE